jgi:hypothetical protein
VEVHTIRFEVCAAVDAVSFGVNASSAQPASWNGELTDAPAPPLLLSVALTVRFAQLVGLNVKPGRSTVRFTMRTCSGMPCRIVGSGLLVTVR